MLYWYHHIRTKGAQQMIEFTVKVMLARRKMTQKQLSEITGVRLPTISRICLGTVDRLPVEALNKICKALDCQPGDLMEYIPDQTDQA